MDGHCGIPENSLVVILSLRVLNFELTGRLGCLHDNDAVKVDDNIQSTMALKIAANILEIKLRLDLKIPYLVSKSEVYF